MSRRAEIEQKRLRLEELRRRRSGNSVLINSNNNDVDTSSSKEIVDEVLDVKKEEVKDPIKPVATPINVEHKKTVDSSAQTERLTYSKGTQTIEEVDDEVQPIPEDNDNNFIENEDNEEDDQPIESQITEESLAEFLQDSFKVINRVINDDKALLESYSISKQHALETSSNYVFYHKLNTNSSTVYSITTSPYTPDLILISAGNTVYLYNSKLQTFEVEFYSHTKIINIQFATFNSNIIIGTGYNGKLVIWDTNQPKKLKNLPILESEVSLDTHSYPVWVLLQLNQEQNTLVTCSTDGKLIQWDPNMLKKPKAEPVQLKLPSNLNLYDELTPLCASTTSANSNITKNNSNKQQHSILLGAEDGNIYKINPNFQFITKIGSSSNTANLIESTFISHEGPVLQISTNPVHQSLFISCSMDWRLHLWNINDPKTPLQTIYKTDAIMDCQWRNETQYGLIYQNTIEIIDLNINSVNPIVKITVEQSKTLNKISFDKDGTFVIASDVDGEVFFYEILIGETTEGVFKRKYVNNN